jgi:hypothetical protein
MEPLTKDNIVFGSISNNAKHGHTKTIDGKLYRSPTYQTWRGMHERCSVKSNGNFKYYGGKGIKVCKRWSSTNGFVNFIKDLGLRPEKHFLSRLDSHKDYKPSNCRWRPTAKRNKK